jgi:uncharacterized membrane protein YkoI
MNKKESGIAFLPVLVVLLVAVIAVAFWTVSSNKKTVNNENTAATAQSALPESFAEVIEPKEVKTYLERLQLSTQIVSIELVTQGEKLVYKVTLSDGKKVTLDAKSGVQVGDILQVTQQATDDTVIDASNVIPIDVARKAAQAARPDKTIRKIELETEDGILVYSVRFTDGSRVDIHATTGEVVLSKTEEKKTDDKSTSDSSNSGSNSGSTDTKKPEDSSAPQSTESAGISTDQARAAAQKALPGLTIEKVESETEEGVAVWSVRFTDGSRVDVRKSDGVVVRTDKKS